MTDAPNRPFNAPAQSRQARLRDALRENLKRRKSQSRGRVDQAAKVLEDAVDTEPGPEREQIDDAS
jgi:hypothetical protein